MDRSATVVRDGHAPYGTDDVSDDVTQDAVLLYAARLRRVSETCERTRDDDGVPGWIYRKHNGETVFITGETLRYWAVRDGAWRNGYRVDVPPSELDATPGAQNIRPRTRAEYVATAYLRETQLASVSDAVFRSAWGDGSDFPTLRDALDLASRTDNLKIGVLSTVAQAIHGGPYGYRYAVKRTRDAAREELREFSARCDDARDAVTGRENGTES
jgi:galactarate dehydratase